MSDNSSQEESSQVEHGGTAGKARILPESPAAGREWLDPGFDDTTSTTRSGARSVTAYDPDTRAAATAPYAGAGAEATGQPAAEQAVPVKRRPSGCTIIAGIIVTLLLACALLMYGALQEGMGRLSGLIPSFGFTTTPTVTIDTSRPTVIERVRALSRLETVHYQLEKVVTGRSSGPLPDLLTSDKILLVAHGEVVAGIDLSRLREGDIEVTEDRVVVDLPEAEILYSRLDNDKTYVYDRQTGIFSKPDPNLETQLRQAAEREIVNSALEAGILQKADENAQDVIRTLITGLGYSQVEFKEGP